MGALRRLARTAVGAALAFATVAFVACSDLGGLSNGGPAEEDAGTDRKVAAPDASAPDDAELVCEDGKTACGTLCSDVKTDAQNCGRCNHDCLGAQCVQGACEPITLASGLNIPFSLALDQTDIYVTVFGSGDVLRIPKAGGSPITITENTISPFGIALELDPMGQAKKVVWGEARGSGSQLLYCTLPDCTTITKVPVTEDVRYIAVKGETAYFTQRATGSGSVRRVSLTGSTQSLLVANEVGAEGIAVYESQLVVSRRVDTGSVRRMSTGGGGAVDLIPALDTPAGVATDGKTVFVAVGGGSAIAKCPLLGCTGPATFALATFPHDVAIDDSNVYWGNGLLNGGSIGWCPIAGCDGGQPRTLAAAQRNPYGIGVDDKAVYWVNSATNGTVMKIAKP